MRFYLGSARIARLEFPQLAEMVAPISESLPGELVSGVAAEAQSAFGWRVSDTGSTLAEDDVRFSLSVSLHLIGFEADQVAELTFGSLRSLAIQSPGLRQNHVIGAALFGKPVADPAGETDYRWATGFDERPYRNPWFEDDDGR